MLEEAAAAEAGDAADAAVWGREVELLLALMERAMEVRALDDICLSSVAAACCFSSLHCILTSAFADIQIGRPPRDRHAGGRPARVAALREERGGRGGAGRRRGVPGGGAPQHGGARLCRGLPGAFDPEWGSG